MFGAAKEACERATAIPRAVACLLWFVTIGLLAVAPGCEAIVGSSVPSFVCGSASLESCPSGSYCRGSACTPCEAKDVCDGLDNDCDGRIDNDACPAGQTCDPSAGGCVIQQTCAPDGCIAPQVCDGRTQQCVTPGAAALGEPCSSDSACATHICGDGSVLTRTITDKAGGSVCTMTCCTSEDCGQGDFVCFFPGTGASYCVRAAWLDRGAVGLKRGGEACTDNTECRAGLCTQNQCRDTCCAETQCASGSACTHETVNNHDAFSCGTPLGTKDVGVSCASNNECHTGFCHAFSNGRRRCVAPCCSSSACADIDYGTGSGPQPMTCVRGATTNGDYLPVCEGTRQGTGNALLGAACQNDVDCRSERCDQTLHKCTDACCVDNDCSSAGWVCRPVSANGLVIPRCQPP